MKRIVLVVACLAACKSDKQPPTAGSASGIATAGSGSAGSGSAAGSAVGSGSDAGSAGSGSAVAADAPPCPTGDALEAKVATLFATTAAKLDFAECAVGRFPAPGWVVAARYSVDDSNLYTEQTAIVDPTGKVLGKVEVEVPPGAIDSSSHTSFQAVDFDKDGVDEIVHVYASDKRGIMQSILLVDRFAKATFEQVLERQFDYDNEASEPEEGVVVCAAKWAIASAADGTRTITFEPVTKPKSPSDACIAAKETWALAAGGKFAKQ